MWKIVVTLLIGGLLADAVWCRAELYRLREESRLAGQTLTQLSTTNSHFESALLSCRYAMDSIRDTAEKRLVQRLNADIGMYRYAQKKDAARDFPTIARRLEDGDVVQARR